MGCPGHSLLVYQPGIPIQDYTEDEQRQKEQGQ